MNHYLVKTVFLTFLLTLTLSAEKKDDNNIYVGIGFGGSAYVDSGFAKEQIAGVDKDIEKDGIGAKVYAGYQVNKIIGLEVSYVYYGSFKANDNYEYHAQGLSAAGNIGYTFLDNQLRPYVLIGLGYIISDFPHDGVDVSDYKPSLHTGLGLTYVPKVLEGMGFRIAYESNSFNYTLHRGTDKEKSYPQGFGILYLGGEYRF